MTKRPFAYVCSPYRGVNHLDTGKAREYCRQLYEAGYTPVCPNLLFPQFLNESIPEERKAALEMANYLLRRCHVIVVCGPKVTDFMVCEIMAAQRLHITTTTLDGVMATHRHKNTPQGNGEVAH